MIIKTGQKENGNIRWFIFASPVLVSQRMFTSSKKNALMFRRNWLNKWRVQINEALSEKDVYYMRSNLERGGYLIFRATLAATCIAHQKTKAFCIFSAMCTRPELALVFSTLRTDKT